MKIVLIAYEVSWLLLLLMFGYVWIRYGYKHLKENTKENSIMWIGMFILGPLLPFVLIPIFYCWLQQKLRKKRFYKSIPCKDDNIIEDCMMILNQIIEISENQQYNRILDCLNKITLDNRYSMVVQNLEQDNELELYITDNHQKSYKLFNKITIEKSYIGVWQAYLLFNFWNTIKNYGYDYYLQQHIINPINDPDYLDTSKTDYTPMISSYKNYYYIQWHFCNSNGIYKEIQEISLNHNKISSVEVVDFEEIYNWSHGSIVNTLW